MPSMEERMTAVERRLRLQDRERAVQRQLFTAALSDVHVRMDDLATQADVNATQASVDALRADVDKRFDETNQRTDAVQADVSAILRLLTQKPPGPT